jgi:hypothetical protein
MGSEVTELQVLESAFSCIESMAIHKRFIKRISKNPGSKETPDGHSIEETIFKLTKKASFDPFVVAKGLSIMLKCLESEI